MRNRRARVKASVAISTRTNAIQTEARKPIQVMGQELLEFDGTKTGLSPYPPSHIQINRNYSEGNHR